MGPNSTRFNPICTAALSLLVLPTLVGCFNRADETTGPLNTEEPLVIKKWNVTDETKVWSGNGIRPLGEVIRTDWKNLDTKSSFFVQTEGYFSNGKAFIHADPSTPPALIKTYTLASNQKGISGLQVTVPIDNNVSDKNSPLINWGNFDTDTKYRVYGINFGLEDSSGFTVLAVEPIK